MDLLAELGSMRSQELQSARMHLQAEAEVQQLRAEATALRADMQKHERQVADTATLVTEVHRIRSDLTSLQVGLQVTRAQTELSDLAVVRQELQAHHEAAQDTANRTTAQLTFFLAEHRCYSEATTEQLTYHLAESEAQLKYHLTESEALMSFLQASGTPTAAHSTTAAPAGPQDAAARQGEGRWQPPKWAAGSSDQFAPAAVAIGAQPLANQQAPRNSCAPAATADPQRGQRRSRSPSVPAADAQRHPLQRRRSTWWIIIEDIEHMQPCDDNDDLSGLVHDFLQPWKDAVLHSQVRIGSTGAHAMVEFSDRHAARHAMYAATVHCPPPPVQVPATSSGDADGSTVME